MTSCIFKILFPTKKNEMLVKTVIVYLFCKRLVVDTEAVMEPVLIVHGGAGDVSDERVPGKIVGVKRAARAGFAVLSSGGSPLDAVQTAVHIMEDDPEFNAGYGAVLNLAGEVEADALFMEGHERRAGAVGNLKDVRHPIDVARLIMERTPHVLLAGDAARLFAEQQGVPLELPGALVTPMALDTLKRVLKSGDTTVHEIGSGGSTVGAVAIDASGYLVSATSTGGMCGKMVGRIGDTALVGCGGFADDNVGAVSTTGHGESIIKSNLAHSIMKLMEDGNSAEAAAEKALNDMTKRVGNSAGAIVLSNKGDIGVSFNSKRMSWAYCKGNNLHYGIDQGQDCSENI